MGVIVGIRKGKNGRNIGRMGTYELQKQIRVWTVEIRRLSSMIALAEGELKRRPQDNERTRANAPAE
jgi:hypothetical protein